MADNKVISFEKQIKDYTPQDVVLKLNELNDELNFTNIVSVYTTDQGNIGLIASKLSSVELVGMLTTMANLISVSMYDDN